MQTVYLRQSAVTPNCSLISWCFPATEFANDIHKIITRFDGTRIRGGKHHYAFNLLPSGWYLAEPLSFDETNMLMHLMPDESDGFYLKAALREFMNTFIVFNSKGDRVYPEDII